MSVSVQYDLWRSIVEFFSALVAPCKECVRGNPTRCWHSQCAAFRMRPLAYRVIEVGVPSANTAQNQTVPNHIAIDSEIVEKLSRYAYPVPASAIRLRSTNSRVKKCHAITRLIRHGIVEEVRLKGGGRLITLKNKKRNPENDNAKN